MVGNKRNFGLDVVRAFSILMVLAAHKFTLQLEWGGLGVQIFFILSGFLIGQILIKEFSEEVSFKRIRKFWKFRWFRTLPLYYLVLVARLLLFGNPYGWKIIVYFFFLQANLVGISFFGVSWSLVVEEWFYLLLPLGALVMLGKKGSSKGWLRYMILGIVVVFALRFSWNYLHKGVILYQFDCLFLGVLVAWLKVYKTNVYTSLNKAWLFLLGVAGMGFFLRLLGKWEDIGLYDTFFRVVWHFLVSICVCVIIPFMEQSQWINQSIRQIKPLYYLLTWISVLTYSLYLIHMDVFHLVWDVSPLMNLLLQTGLLFSICFTVYALFEHPAMTLRNELSLNRYLRSIKEFSFKI